MEPPHNNPQSPSAQPIKTPPGSREKDESRFATVLQVLPALGAAGGVERGTVEVAEAIVRAGGRALVVSSGGPLVRAVERAGAVHVALPVASKNPFVMHANAGRLAALIEREGVDIVHARSRAPAWSAWMAARRTGRRFVTTFHGTYGGANWFKRRYNAIMTRGARVIAISAFIAGHIQQLYGVPSERIRIVHRGVDLGRFDSKLVTAERVVKLATAWRLTDGLPVVMLPARLTRWKGQTVFLDAIARLGRSDVRAVLVGGAEARAGFHAELEGQIARLGLESVVRLVGQCNDMPAAYMLADVVVSASIEPEAFGRVVAEAQAMGRPIIATDHGGAKECVIAGETGWLVAPNDADALAEAIRRTLALGPDARRALAARAVAHIAANFSKEAMCAKTLAVYDEVMAAPGAQAPKP
ncbi:MAG: glycosyltransferase [Rhodospirillales bacterium]|nr:glycosyltransferase [Rhodospirillales bacterium]MSP79664.1 glycosyltransferase [Rhodospirillales bacterium]